MSTYENMELLGMQVDAIENLLAAMQLPIPPAVHLAALKPSLAEIAVKLRQVYVAETGDDPWTDHPKATPQQEAGS